MILYFSATGNSKYVAEKIAKELNDNAVSITSIKDKKIEVNEDNFGIVIPTCFWSMPIIVKDFLNNTSIIVNKSSYSFMVVTYGSFTGSIGKDLEKVLKEKNIHLDSRFSVKMPDTWTPFFDLSDYNKNNTLLKKAEKEINKILNHVKNKTTGDFINNKLPRLITIIFKPIYNYFRKTSNFKVNEKCISCGKCIKKCPSKAIKMVNNKPVWIKDKCTLCLGCMHRCPKFAIEYRKRAKNHGQYTNPNTIL